MDRGEKGTYRMRRGTRGLALLLGVLLSSVTLACDPTEGLYKRLLRHEGLRLCVYEDTLGNPTIGVGHLLRRPVAPGLCWSRSHVISTLYADIDRARHGARHLIPGWHKLSTVHREVLTELTFQIGAGRLAGFRKMLNAVKIEDWARASRELLNSLLARQTSTRTRELACLMTADRG